jgi:YegS C-terminal NAD kinase beta sandwich-like domain
MTVSKGAEWGERVARPDGLVVAASDVELAALVGGGSSVPLAVAGGDLRRTLGDSPPGPTMHRVTLDVLRVVADGTEVCAVAHVVARRSWWRGRIVGVFNCEHLGRWDVAPRGHPNDGLAEVVDVDPTMTLRQRIQAWRRLPSGTHVPHPAIGVSRAASVNWEFAAPLTLHVDGVRRGAVRRLAVTVDADAYHLYV